MDLSRISYTGKLLTWQLVLQHGTVYMWCSCFDYSLQQLRTHPVDVCRFVVQRAREFVNRSRPTTTDDNVGHGRLDDLSVIYSRPIYTDWHCTSHSFAGSLIQMTTSFSPHCRHHRCLSVCLCLCVYALVILVSHAKRRNRSICRLGPKTYNYIRWSAYGRHLANAIELCAFSGNAGCRYRYFSNLSDFLPST